MNSRLVRRKDSTVVFGCSFLQSDQGVITAGRTSKRSPFNSPRIASPRM